MIDWLPAVVLLLTLGNGTVHQSSRPAPAPTSAQPPETGQPPPPEPLEVRETVDVTGSAAPPLDPGVPAQFTVTASDLEALRGALLDDPLRALQALPGVATTDELRADLSVRHSPYRQVGLVIDDIKSRLLMHTVRGVEQTGSVALLNGDTVASAALSAGSYPQRYGNSLGAELVVRTKDGRDDRLHGRLMTSLIATTATLDGPLFSDRVTWLVAARRSYASWIVTRIDPDLSGTFDFQDVFAKVGARVGGRQTLSLTWLGGSSRYDERGRRTEDYALDVGRHRTQLLSGQWQITPTPTTLVGQRLTYVTARFRNTNPDGLLLDDGREREVLARTSASWTSGRLSVDASASVEGFALDGEAVRFGGVLSGRPRVFTGRTSRVGGHVHGLGALHPRLQVGLGVRVDRVDEVGAAASPWGQLSWAIGSRWRLQAAHGWHRQSPDLLMRVGPNAGGLLEMERARQSDLGLTFQAGPWSAAATAYLRREDEVLDAPLRFPRLLADGGIFPGEPRAAWLNALAGEARGVELVLRRHAARWSGWLSYAQGRLRQRLPFDQPAFSGAFEQRRIFNATAQATLTPRWDASAALRLASNWPYEGYFTERDGTVFLAGARNRLRLPAYARLDLRVRHRVPIGTRHLMIFGEAINVLNRRNIRQVEGSFNPRTGEVRRIAEEQLPIIPSIGLAFEW